MNNKESVLFSLAQLLFALFGAVINILLLIVVITIKPDFWVLFVIFVIVIIACIFLVVQSIIAFCAAVKKYIKEGNTK